MIGGGQKTKIHPRSVDVMPLTEDKFEVREKFHLIFHHRWYFWCILSSTENFTVFLKICDPVYKNLKMARSSKIDFYI